MKKDIYIIRNRVNNKVYIGQSVNAKQRWQAHLSNSRTKNTWSAVDYAINKIGINNFYYEIIERTENYDEKERYWIKYYNSVMPNGYNYCDGGSGSGAGTGSANGKIRNNETLENIINALLYSQKTQKEIANDFAIDKRIVSSINRGTSYRLDCFTYPLRKKRKDVLLKDIKNIQKDLYSKEYTKQQLANKYSYSLKTIDEINKGILGKSPDYTYPIYCGSHSKIDKQQFLNLINDLQKSNMTIAELAEKYSISTTQVRNINTGRSRKQSNLSYPLRKC